MPLPQVSAGTVLQQVTEREVQLGKDVSELQVRQLWKARADEMTQRLQALPQSWTQEKDRLRSRLAKLTASDAPMVEVRSLERELESYPGSVEQARVAWSQARAVYE